MRVAPELERLFERSDDPVFLLDPASDRILSANRAACRMLGFTRDELLATPISHVHPAEMPQLLDFVEHVMGNGHGSTIKLTCRTKCGDFLPAEIALFALVDGAETRVLALVQDRCQHRQGAGDGWVAGQVSDSDDRHTRPVDNQASFEQLFEESDDPAFVIDPVQNQILAANRAGCELFGYTREELLATPVSHIHPADLPQLRDFVERVLRDGHGSTMKLTCRTKSGGFLPVEMTLVALDSAGRPRILGLIHDRSEHRQREPG